MTRRARRFVVGALLVGGLAIVSLGLLEPATGALETPEVPVEVWVERQKVTPDDADQPGNGNGSSHWGVHFGSEVVIDGDTAVVGTQLDMNSDSGWADGHDWAYVFERDKQGTWTQTSKLVPSDAGPSDTFGFSLDLDEEAGVIVAGNPDGQKIYVFERAPNGTWDEVAIFEGEEDLFGYAVAVSGDTIVTNEDDYAAVFQRTSSGWARVGAIHDVVAPIDIVDDTFVGASMPNYWDMAVYEEDDGEWTRTAELPRPTASPSGEDPLPGAVSLSADKQTILVGAGTDSRLLGTSNGHSEMAASGSVWIYEFQDGGWEMTAEISNPDPWWFDKFGYSIGLAGDRAVIGAYGDTQSGADGGGAVYVVDRIGEEWTVTSKLRNSDGPPWAGFDFFGRSVDISGETILAGAPMDDNRRDGTPPPLDDKSSLRPCQPETLVTGCGEGMNAGSAYVFEPVNRGVGLTPG